jgi:GGDEF domain-containing protein
LERDYLRLLAEVSEQRGDLEGALRHWKDSDALNHQLHGLDQVRRIAALEQEVANAAREQELSELRSREALQSSQISRARWIGGMGVICLLAVALALSAKVRYARKRALADEQARIALAGQNQALEKLANTDALTGLHNRQWMHQRLEALKSAHLHQSEMATRHHREARSVESSEN